MVQTTVYYVAVPLPLETVYEKLAAWQDEPVTEEDKANAAHIYSMVVGSTGSDTFDGSYTPGGGSSVELDASDLTNPTTKNAADLVAYVTNAWQSGWGYVWGTYGQVLTPELFQYKLTQYPEGVGQYADFIRSNRLGKHAADCVGLIKGYGWLDADTDLLITNVFHVSIDDFLADVLHIDEATTATSILHGEGERKLLGDVVRAVIHYIGEKGT